MSAVRRHTPGLGADGDGVHNGSGRGQDLRDRVVVVVRHPDVRAVRRNTPGSPADGDGVRPRLRSTPGSPSPYWRRGSPPRRECRPTKHPGIGVDGDGIHHGPGRRQDLRDRLAPVRHPDVGAVRRHTCGLQADGDGGDHFRRRGGWRPGEHRGHQSPPAQQRPGHSGTQTASKSRLHFDRPVLRCVAPTRRIAYRVFKEHVNWHCRSSELGRRLPFLTVKVHDPQPSSGSLETGVLVLPPLRLHPSVTLGATPSGHLEKGRHVV